MPPKKLPPQKKKSKTAEASSSRTPQPELISNREFAKARKKKLRGMELMNIQYLDWTVLDLYGLVDLLPQVVQDRTWFTLFHIKERAYHDITIEFLSTLTMEKEEHATFMKFQAYGEVRRIDVKRVGYLLGFYEDPETARELPNSWPHDMDPSKFWLQLIAPSTEPFEPSKSLATTFPATEHKLLHHIIAHTISGKKTSHSKVTNSDMFYLYSLTTGYRIDLGVEVANYLDKQSKEPRTKVILCGGYITALLKGMGIFQEPEGDEGIPCKMISDAPFRQWGLSKRPSRTDQAEEIEALEMAPAGRPSTSRTTPPARTHDQLLKEIKDLREENKKERERNKKERKKNKKFRTTLFQMIKSAFTCSTSTDIPDFQYQTSSEEDSDPEADS